MTLKVTFLSSREIELIRHLQHVHDAKDYYNALVLKKVFDKATFAHFYQPLELHFEDNHFSNVDILNYKALHKTLSKFFNPVKFTSDNKYDEILDPEYFTYCISDYTFQSVNQFWQATVNNNQTLTYHDSMKMFGLHTLRPDVHRLAALVAFEKQDLWPHTDCKIGFSGNYLMADETWRSSGLDLCAKTMQISHMDILALLDKLPKSSRFFRNKGQEIQSQQMTILDVEKNSLNANFLIEIICDSSHSDHTFGCSEKFIRCLLLKQPFIIVGRQHTYRTFHRGGIRTFDHLWPETWDNFNSTELQLKVSSVAQTCRHIVDTYTVKDLYEMTRDTVEHNYDMIKDSLDKFYENLSCNVTSAD
jgi:hypothetical protein